MRKSKKVLLSLLGVSAVAMLTGCGILRGPGNSATDMSPNDDTYFTMWIHSGPGSAYYTEYEENNYERQTIYGRMEGLF